jgi:NADH-quinone oxidoreductase subunit H
MTAINSLAHFFLNSIATNAYEPESIATRAGDVWVSNPWMTVFWVALGILVMLGFLVLIGMGLIYGERKIAAHFQCRLGPMRVGWHGLLQVIADTLKLLVKEDLVPAKADRVLHLLAPVLAIMATLLTLAIVPASPLFQLIDVNIGVIYVTAMGSIGVLGILLGGWSSNNKWSLLGAMRAGAQIISYEVSATLALLIIVMFAGSMQLSEIVQSQASGWWIWRSHLVGIIAFFTFIIASTAELNRVPFDLPEGESELTAGFHTEYSGMRFAFFFLAEFINMFVASAIAATLFLGGWMPFQIGGLEGFNEVMRLIPPGVWFAMKTGGLIFLLMWFRWTFPRLRIDQMMGLEWKFLLPVGFANLLLAAVLILMGWYFAPIPV